jgi:hypothetical protein
MLEAEKNLCRESKPDSLIVQLEAFMDKSGLTRIRNWLIRKGCNTRSGFKQKLSFGIATGYAMDGRDSIPGRGKRLFSTPQLPDRLLGPIKRVPEVISLGVKRPGHEADHSPPSSAEVKNGGDMPPLPQTSSWGGA